jgi:two-component system, OmpR family, sensor histidine kinase KdpD
MSTSARSATTQDPIDGAEGRLERWLRRFGPDVAIIAVALVVGALVVAILEQIAGFDNGSPAFLLAVVVVAVLRGTGPAIATAVGSFLAYDYLFTAPQFTLTVADPDEWLNLLLLLVVGVVVGRLAGRERDRAEEALAGEREARALFKVSFSLANRSTTGGGLAPIASMLRDETRMSRVWVIVADAVAADTGAPGAESRPPANPPVHISLRRMPGDEPAMWVRVHLPGRGNRGGAAPTDAIYKVVIASGERTFGAVWATRARAQGDPDPGETRVLAAAADQIAGSLERERLSRDATAAEISRRSDALKSALLDSVSHDLRTPLSSIRAAAGLLADPDVDWPADKRRAIATSIDRDADWLNRLVTNLLDMSRIEAGELKPNVAVFDLGDLVRDAVERSAAAHGSRRPDVAIEDGLPPVAVDEVFVGQTLVNLIDNAVKYAGDAVEIRIGARRLDDRQVRVTVEDAGPGVPEALFGRLAEKFYRVPRIGEGSRRGTGIGLSVVKGLVDAMDGAMSFRRSALGGLAVDVDLPAAKTLPEVTELASSPPTTEPASSPPTGT